MGLDIIAISNVKAVTNPVENEWGYVEGAYKAYVLGDNFNRSLRGLEKNYYYTETEDSETIDFRAGSYSGYNLWREMLSVAALGVSANEVWENPEKYQDEPFYEFINFADNEGTIGSIAAGDLAADFADFEEKIKEGLTGNEDDDWFMDKYADWKEACELAAQNGMIIFC